MVVDAGGAEVNDDWNLANAWEAIADAIGDAACCCTSAGVRTWSEFDERAAALAGLFAAHGVGRDAKVAHYLYNGPEYVETTYASFKARAIPVNVNYRYTRHELAYLLDNCDAEAVVVDHTLADRVLELRDELPRLRLVVTVGGDAPARGDAADDGVLHYESAIAVADPAPRIDRGLDDLWFLYTGGTTGMPKGVMWPHRSLLHTMTSNFTGYGLVAPSSPADAARSALVIRDAGASRLLPAAPLMHGTSAITTLGTLTAAGSIVTLDGRSFDAVELLDAVERHEVTSVVIVGDAFGTPILAALDDAAARGEGWDLGSLRSVISSGVMWSEESKQRLLGYADVVLADLLGSSEAVGAARSVSSRTRGVGTAVFKLGPNSAVFTPDGRRVIPGSDERGLVAVRGAIPLGYYKDPEKTASTFREFEGDRWSVAGDWATVAADGTINLLGRGSNCINTAGEKVFPEEVEETLKLHPSVRDALVVGIPDPKWGSAVSAVVSLERGATAISDEELSAHCRTTLAGYKCPKHVVRVEEVRRGPNGKADYRWALDTVSAASSPADG